jgi:hypothetical protein
MKKLNRLQINSDKILKNEELSTLRGGYGYLVCKTDSGEICMSRSVTSCIYAGDICNIFCPPGWSAVCAGD